MLELWICSWSWGKTQCWMLAELLIHSLGWGYLFRACFWTVRLPKGTIRHLGFHYFGIKEGWKPSGIKSSPSGWWDMLVHMQGCRNRSFTRYKKIQQSGCREVQEIFWVLRFKLQLISLAVNETLICHPNEINIPIHCHETNVSISRTPLMPLGTTESISRESPTLSQKRYMHCLVGVMI